MHLPSFPSQSRTEQILTSPIINTGKHISSLSLPPSFPLPSNPHPAWNLPGHQNGHSFQANPSTKSCHTNRSPPIWRPDPHALNFMREPIFFLSKSKQNTACSCYLIALNAPAVLLEFARFIAYLHRTLNRVELPLFPFREFYPCLKRHVMLPLFTLGSEVSCRMEMDNVDNCSNMSTIYVWVFYAWHEVHRVKSWQVFIVYPNSVS